MAGLYPTQFWRRVFSAALLSLLALHGAAQTNPIGARAPGAPPATSPEYRLAAGDQVVITVFQNPELTTEARISEGGIISFPLLGAVQIGGLSVTAAEALIAQQLAQRNFVKSPFVNIVTKVSKGRQVTVFGYVHKPGIYSTDTTSSKVSDLIAQAGGIQPEGADLVVLTGTRDGKPYRLEVPMDLVGGVAVSGRGDIVEVVPGDTVFVPKAPVYFVQGEVVRPGGYRILRGMTVLQAIAQAGGKTVRGTLSRLLMTRTKEGTNEPVEITPTLTDLVRDGDVITVRESIF